MAAEVIGRRRRMSGMASWCRRRSSADIGGRQRAQVVVAERVGGEKWGGEGDWGRRDIPRRLSAAIRGFIRRIGVSAGPTRPHKLYLRFTSHRTTDRMTICSARGTEAGQTRNTWQGIALVFGDEHKSKVPWRCRAGRSSGRRFGDSAPSFGRSTLRKLDSTDERE